MPVHSVHHDTVQTEAALANLMSAPSSMLTNAIPPIMVEDNYCFVVDGERVRMGDILGDDQWWRHTSRPTKYFYSDDLRQFHRVNCITAKGKVITAKLATQVSPGICAVVQTFDKPIQMPHQPSTSMSASMSHQQSLSASTYAPVHPQHHSMSNTPRYDTDLCPVLLSSFSILTALPSVIHEFVIFQIFDLRWYTSNCPHDSQQDGSSRREQGPVEQRVQSYQVLLVLEDVYLVPSDSHHD